MNVLVTGGLGYIGSHTTVYLLENGYNVVVLDNLSNSKIDVIDKIKEITKKDFKFYKGDMIDKEFLRGIFRNENIDAVIDFAAYKAVGESVEKPVEYYTNNVATVLNLLSVMKEFGVKKLIFSSSATVYGTPEVVPIKETAKVGGTTNPYGTSKLMVEKILEDLYKSDNSFDIMVFRYFNPIGAHPSGLLGEDPKGIPANLMPYIVKVANGELPCLSVFGNDYDTKDGTGVRDYIHICDLAEAHISGLKKLEKEGKGYFVYNLGTGTGYSVLEIISAFEKVNNIKVNYKIAERRAGDIAECYADSTKAYNEIGFKCKRNIEDMCRDAYNFVVKNSKN